MENLGLGAGLAAMGFWGFVAVAVIAGVWSDIKKKQAQQETVRRLIESGQKIDPDTLDRLMAVSNKSDKRQDRDLKIAGFITLAVALGLGVFGWLISQSNADAMMPLMGVALLVGCVGGGLFIAGKFAERWYKEDLPSNLNDV